MQQKWYYISDQTADEAWMFVQSDSCDGGQLGKPGNEYSIPADQPLSQEFHTAPSAILPLLNQTNLAKVSKSGPLHTSISH